MRLNWGYHNSDDGGEVNGGGITSDKIVGIESNTMTRLELSQVCRKARRRAGRAP